MVDSKARFVLSLQGKEYAGHLDHWSVDSGDLAGLHCGDYQLTARSGDYEIINNEYAISKHAYVTLGQQCTHKEIVKIHANAALTLDMNKEIVSKYGLVEIE